MGDIHLVYDPDRNGTMITADTSHHGHGVQVRQFSLDSRWKARSTNLHWKKLKIK